MSELCNSGCSTLDTLSRWYITSDMSELSSSGCSTLDTLSRWSIASDMSELCYSGCSTLDTLSRWSIRLDMIAVIDMWMWAYSSLVVKCDKHVQMFLSCICLLLGIIFVSHSFIMANHETIMPLLVCHTTTTYYWLRLMLLQMNLCIILCE